MKYETSRELAFEAYKKIVINRGYSNLVLESMLEEAELSPRDKALAAKITYGTLQWQGYLDYYLDFLLKRPRAEIARDALFLLRLGAYQILILDKIPSRSAVDETVKLARKKMHRGIASLVNGTLRNLVRKYKEIELPDSESTPLEYLSVKYSHPSWMVEVWYHELGFERTERLLKANNESPERTVRVNTLKTSRDEFVSELASFGIAYEFVPQVLEGLIINNYEKLLETPFYHEGKYQPQDINSMIVSLFVLPGANEKIIDMCSAPGSKTTHLAQLKKNKGKIIAVDINRAKLNRVHEACKRMGINCVTPLLGDARRLFKDERLGKHEKEAFDACLVDAPCSGLGTLRRHPELKWTFKHDDITRLAKQQQELLVSAHKLLKPGGRLIYSTCTISKRENQLTVSEFLKSYPGYKLEHPSDFIDQQAIQNAEINPDGLTQFYPGYGSGDGFFIARLKKPTRA